jgi:hypothetical protein
VDPAGLFIQCTDDGTCYDDGYSISDPYFTSYSANERRESLRAYNNLLYKWARKGWITDLDAFAELSDYAASMIPPDTKGNRTKTFVDDVGAVLHQYEDHTVYDRAKHLNQSGFHRIFQDPGSGGDQPHHFWFYTWKVFNPHRAPWPMAPIPADVANLLHEMVIARRGKGRSYQDFALGQEGVNLGQALRRGSVEIEDVGDYIRRNLGAGSSLAGRWTGTVSGEVNKRFYAVCLTAGSFIVPIPAGEQGGAAYPAAWVRESASASSRIRTQAYVWVPRIP